MVTWTARPIYRLVPPDLTARTWFGPEPGHVAYDGSAGRADGSGPGSCLVLLAASREGSRAMPISGPTLVLCLAASWQPPHVSNRYTTLDHLLSRVLPRYDEGSSPATALADRVPRGSHASGDRRGQKPQSFLISVSRSGRRSRACPSSSITSTGPRTLLISHTASRRAGRRPWRACAAVCQPASAARSNSSAGSCRRGCRSRPSGVVCSVRPTAHTTEPVGASSTQPVGRDEQRVLGAAAGRLALRGHVHRVRERLDAAQQPRRVAEGVGGVPAVEHDDADALRRAGAGSRRPARVTVRKPVGTPSGARGSGRASSRPRPAPSTPRTPARRARASAGSSNAISSAAAERVIRARCRSSLSAVLVPSGPVSTRIPSKQPSPRVTPGIVGADDRRGRIDDPAAEHGEQHLRHGLNLPTMAG